MITYDLIQQLTAALPNVLMTTEHGTVHVAAEAPDFVDLLEDSSFEDGLTHVMTLLWEYDNTPLSWGAIIYTLDVEGVRFLFLKQEVEPFFAPLACLSSTDQHLLASVIDLLLRSNGEQFGLELSNAYPTGFEYTDPPLLDLVSLQPALAAWREILHQEFGE